MLNVRKKSLIIKVIQWVGVFTFCYQYSMASHVIGGDISVKWISGNQFEITAHVFRDCLNGLALLDPTINLGIYDKKNDTLGMPNLTLPLISSSPLELGDKCYVPDGICVEQGVYQDVITIPDNPNGYYLSWQRWARNYNISNILCANTPTTQAGITLYAEIPDPSIHNSTPSFGSYPNAYMCLNQSNTKDFSSIDLDEDSLVYSLITPLSCNGDVNVAIPPPGPKPYPNVIWVSPYNLSDIIGGTPPMSINANTGIISGSPNAMGIFVFAVRVEQYDKKTKLKLGEIRRDVQYQVINSCNANKFPEFTSPTVTNYTIVGIDSVCFNVAFKGNNFGVIDSLSISATSEVFSKISPNGKSEPKVIFSDVSGLENISTSFCLQTECDNMRKAPYKVTFTGKDSSCYGVDNVILEVNFYVTTLDGYLKDPIPNVFTPNGDNANDRLKVNAQPNNCFDTFFMKIYDRWGNLVYETSDFRFEWDGKHFKNNKELPEGVYYYALEGSFIENKIKRNGTVVIFRGQ